MIALILTLLKIAYVFGVGVFGFAYAAAHPDARNCPNSQAVWMSVMSCFWPLLLVLTFFEGTPHADRLVAKIDQLTGSDL